MGGILATIREYLYGKEDPLTPIKGSGPRIKNLFIRHFRGLIGGFLPLIILPIFVQKNNKPRHVYLMWIWMAWSFLFQPVNVPVTGLIPLFVLPMTCTMSSEAVCSCYMNEGIALFIAGNMLLLLWNNSGLDRRLILWCLGAGDTVQFTPIKLLFKSSFIAFFLSMFCNKLIVANIMMQYIAPLLQTMQSTTTRILDPDYDEMRYIICNAIQTSCAFGSLAIIHSSYPTLAMRGIFYTTAPKGWAWHDIFNYLEYTTFAFPVALVMFILNFVYHCVLISMKCKTKMSALSLTRVRDSLRDHKKDVPSKVTLHEWLTFFFSILILAMYFFRFNKYIKGWAYFTINKKNKLPGLRDATVATFFVILLHALPCGIRFIKMWSITKKSKYGKAKPESGILWWRFVDKNIIYGYLFLIGSGTALSAAVASSTLSTYLKNTFIGSIFYNKTFPVYIFLVSTITVIMANVMSSVAVVVTLLPLLIQLNGPIPSLTDHIFLREYGKTTNIPIYYGTNEHLYLGALCVGMGASCAFMNPFLYTAAYFCNTTGKVPRLKMAFYGLFSALIATFVLDIYFIYYAPRLWDAHKIGIILETGPINLSILTSTTTTTTEATTAADLI